ncbi:MAG: hypothetical protein JXJ20_09490 [Anaerolineae bacterium]|nr:hypothetical protein [Anaerolineae bacterium]
MPIADAELHKAANAHLTRHASQTVYQALKAWRGTPGSYEWWWLIIDHGHQHFTAIRFEGLRDMLAHPDLDVTMDTLLADLPPYRDNPANWEQPFPGVLEPAVVDQAEISTARALRMRDHSPGHLLIVLSDEQFRGILSTSERIFAFTDKPLLDMLEEYEEALSAEPPPLAAPDTDPTPPETSETPDA